MIAHSLFVRASKERLMDDMADLNDDIADINEAGGIDYHEYHASMRTLHMSNKFLKCD